jgi:large subunit ribosomal protein L24
LPPAATAPPNANAPVVSQQIAPLPPPIEVRPAPGVLRQPKPRPPLVLTPPPVAPPRPLF